jgi:hypothetical protein
MMLLNERSPRKEGGAKGNRRRGAASRTPSRIGVSFLASRVREPASAASPSLTRGGSRRR